jgi:hypothetical protein
VILRAGKDEEGELQFAEAKLDGASIALGKFCLLASWIVVHALAA